MAGSLMLINPRKRKRKTSIKRARNPVRGLRRVKHRIKRRRNPIGSAAGGIMGSMQGGAIGAAGAIGAKMLTSFLPLPDALKTGPAVSLVNAVIGAGFGMLVGKFASKKLGEQIGTGAVTVALYDAMRVMLAGKVPGLSGSDDLFSDSMGAYADMGAYDPMNGTSSMDMENQDDIDMDNV